MNYFQSKPKETTSGPYLEYESGCIRSVVIQWQHGVVSAEVAMKRIAHIQETKWGQQI